MDSGRVAKGAQEKVANGNEVQQDGVIAFMEAMKTEMHVTAHSSGRITLQAHAGSDQNAGAPLACID